MRRFLSCLLLAGSAIAAQAQSYQPCAIDEARQQMIKTNPSLKQQMDDNFKALLQAAEASNNAAGKTTATVDTIPVVFHIVLTAAQIAKMGGMAGAVERANSQIAALNRDFNANNPDSTKIPGPFKQYYGDFKLHFGLAHTDPDGKWTSGFTIDTTALAGFDPMGQFTAGSGQICSDAKYKASGGADAWNTGKYLNVWVVNTVLNANQQSVVAGIATHPSFNWLPAQEQGVVIYYLSFGQKQKATQSFMLGSDSGRVLVHEVGHFLGLWHTWGNDNGDCSVDDFINDTPLQADATQSTCPVFPHTDACTPSGNGVMFMNYMDYSTQKCQVMFTKGQAAVAKTAITQAYPQLVQNPQLLRYPMLATAVNDVMASYDMSIVPNPSNGLVNILFTKQPVGLKDISIINITGRVVKVIPATPGQSAYTVDLQNEARGIYYIRCRNNHGQTMNSKLVLQ